MLRKENFYFCYSSKLSKYLQSKGFRYLFMARETSKNNLFTLYERTEELSDALEQYKSLS